ncbi:hypothetical protein GGQ54_002611 [Naumannella cuiyingiana]|uniref:Peptidase MA-like domain-containing protein n=1 Tax=Naumannella cuiyingiana TaxID=1347891 RepID=A0A7Z0ILY4_9ACTN|nr:hypothetical protein [Naumannella cuiyingiana]NYI72051.1 hypothetical protein [Naumannella cuiyingiana]
MAAASMVLPGCAAPPTTAPGEDDPRVLLGDLVRAAVDDDRGLWESRSTPGGAATTDLLRSNLARLDLRGLAATGRQRPPGPGDPRGDRVIETTVTWSVDGWSVQRATPLWLVVEGTGDAARLAGIGAATTGAELPVWALEPVEPRAAGDVAVLAADDPAPWLAAAGRSGGELLIIVPRNADGFARLTGGSGRTGTAALTRSGSDDRGEIIVNPAVGRLTPEGRGVLIAHEAVHVETASWATDAPLWVEEGYAEWRAQQAWPEAVGEMDAILADGLRGRVPSGVPTDAEFGSGGTGYGRALLAWRVIAGGGPEAVPRAERAYAELAAGEPPERVLTGLGLSERELAAEIDRRIAELRGGAR